MRSSEKSAAGAETQGNGAREPERGRQVKGRGRKGRRRWEGGREGEGEEGVSSHLIFHAVSANEVTQLAAGFLLVTGAEEATEKKQPKRSNREEAEEEEEEESGPVHLSIGCNQSGRFHQHANTIAD